MDILQRGPIFRTDSNNERPYYRDGYDGAQGYQFELRRWRESAREEAFSTARLSPEVNAVQKYAQALTGNFGKRKKYRSPFFDNRLNNSRQSDLALLTDTNPTIAVTSAVEAYKQQAEMAQMSIQGEWQRCNMDLDLVRCMDITKLNGTGFWKIGAALPGILQVVPCGPESVMPIQPGFDIQESTAVLYRTWKSLSYFRNKFPYAAAGLEKESTFLDQANVGSETRFNRPSDIPEFTWNGLSPQMKRAVGVQSGASDMASFSMFQNLELQEYYVDDPSVNESREMVLMRHPYLSLKAHNYWYWVKPGQRLYPRKRLIVFGGRKPVYDGPAPFWHGLYPFACMRLNPVPWSFWGMSKYRDLLPLNDAMNEIGAGIMDMIKRALNPVAVTKAGAIPTASWKEFYQDAPGSKLQMMPNANIGDFRYMDPPNIPSWVIQFHQYLSTEFDRLAGSIDVNGLGKKKQVPGGDTIEQMRELMNSITRLEGRYVEKFLEDAGVIAVSNFFQFWQIDTRLKTMGAAGISWADFDTDMRSLIPDNIPKEDFWRSFPFKVSQGSLLTSAKDREKQMAINLGMRHLIPIVEMYRRLEVPKPEAMRDELMQEMQAGVGGGGGARAPRSTRGQRNGQAA
jgi:hypothetical protein